MDIIDKIYPSVSKSKIKSKRTKLKSKLSAVKMDNQDSSSSTDKDINIDQITTDIET